jgi:hypothetical protein
LNKEIERIKRRSLKGLIEAQMLIRRDMDTTPPLIPIDTGNLRASYFAVTSKGGIKAGAKAHFKGDQSNKLSADHSSVISGASNLVSTLGRTKGSAVMMGFSAFYAWFVHEMVGANFGGHPEKVKYTKKGKPTSKTKKFFRRSGAGAKFFEASIKRNKNKVLKIIWDNAKIS